jgi:hypothetical protein
MSPTQTDADPQRATEYRQHGEIDADHRQGDQNADEDQQRTEHLGEDDAQVAVEVPDAQQALLEQVRRPQR